jgi:Domain of unknown function (DUF4440)
MSCVRDVILASEKARCLAMINGDLKALDALLDEELSFSHATGAVDTKSAYLKKMKSGRIVYRWIDWSEQQIMILTDAVVLCGRMKSIVVVEGKEKELDNRVLTVWRLTGSWRLLAFQSTPLVTAGQAGK